MSANSERVTCPRCKKVFLNYKFLKRHAEDEHGEILSDGPQPRVIRYVKRKKKKK